MAVRQAPLDQVAICRHAANSQPGEHSQHRLAHPPRAGAKLGARRLDLNLLVDGGNGFEIHHAPMRQDDHGSIELSPARMELAEDKGVHRLGVRHAAVLRKAFQPPGKSNRPGGEKAVAELQQRHGGGHITHRFSPRSCRPQQRIEARKIVLGRSLRRDQQRAGFEPHSPMVVSGAIARLERGIGVPRRDAEPVLSGNAQDHRARVVQKQHGPIDQPIAALQSNSDVGALVGLAAQAPAQNVVALDKE